MDIQKKETKAYKALVRAGLSLVVAVLLPLMLLVSVPFEVYAANCAEFIFTLSDFFPALIGFFFLFTFVIFAAIFFLPKKAFRIVSAILIAFALLCFVQGNYLNGNLSSIGGDNISERASTGVAVVNIIVWVAVIAVAVVLACLKDKKNIVSYVAGVLAVVLLMTQIVAPISVSISKKEALDSAANKRHDFANSEPFEILTDKNLYTPSKQGNVFWFVIDKFDENYAEHAYDYEPEVIDGLEGFTWFQNHLSSYNRTYPAIAEMLTDNEYDPHLFRRQWLQSAYENPEPLNVMNDNGYDVNLFTEWYFGYDEAESLPDYVQNLSMSHSFEIRDKVGLAFSVVGVGLYRELPFFVKSLITIDSTTSNNYIDVTDKDGNMQYASSRRAEPNFSTREGKGFYFIHTEGCHAAYDPLYGGLLAVNSLKEVSTYLDYLKSEGLYEDATIIITGDHGSAEEDGFSHPALTALFAKPAGVGSGELKISHAPTSHKNLWATIFKSENITTDKDYGLSVFDVAEDAVVERYITSLTYNLSFHAITYRVVGDANDYSNWEEVSDLHLDKRLID